MVGMVESELANFVMSTFTELKSQNSRILKNQEEILEKLDAVQNDLKKVNQKLDEQILRDARVGIRHLIDGINSGSTKVKDSEYQLARQKFTSLIELNPNEVTKGTSGEVDNKFLISFGYYGSFHYFNLQNDRRSAAIQVYECVERWIEWETSIFALKMFSHKFFSKNYYEIMMGKVQEIIELEAELGIGAGNVDSPWLGISKLGAAAGILVSLASGPMA